MLARPANLAIVASTLVTAWLLDICAHAGGIGLGVTCLIVLSTGLVITLGRPSNGWARILVAAAVVVAPWLTLRSSPWLQWPDLLAATGLLIGAAVLAYNGNPFGVSAALIRGRFQLLTDNVARAPIFLGAVVAKIGFTGPSLPVKTVGRGLAIATPVALAIGFLLASADPVFASFFNLQLDPVDITGHLGILGAGVWIIGGLLGTALAQPSDAPFKRHLRLDPIEAIVVLVVLDALFAVFALAQLVSALGGGAEALKAAHMTYADYARSGFFQLLAVAGIILPVLIGLILVTRGQGSRIGSVVTMLAELAVLFTIAIVVVAHQRLSLYEQTYGFTMLRLYSHVFALWMGIVFVLFGLSILTAGANMRSLPGAAAASGLVILLALNLVNPEALVVHLNIDQSRTTQRLDSVYLAGLSDDAVPALFEGLSRLDAEHRGDLHRLVCQQHAASQRSWADYNLAAQTAADARRRCG